MVLAASALARAFAAARLADDRRDEPELHFDLTSSCESGGVFPRLDMSADWRGESQDPDDALDV